MPANQLILQRRNRMRNGTVSQESAAGPELDDEPVYFTPNQQRIIRAGELARAEQERLERESRLLRGQTPS
jgi:hypothetical protein